MGSPVSAVVVLLERCFAPALPMRVEVGPEDPEGRPREADNAVGEATRTPPREQGDPRGHAVVCRAVACRERPPVGGERGKPEHAWPALSGGLARGPRETAVDELDRAGRRVQHLDDAGSGASAHPGEGGVGPDEATEV